MKKIAVAFVAACALAIPTQASAKIEGLDPSAPGSASTAADALAAEPAQVSGASLPEYAYEGESPASSPIGVGDASQEPAPKALAGFPTKGATYAILSSGEINTIASLLTNEAESTSGIYGQQTAVGVERGPAAHDWTVLKVDVIVPGGDNCLALDYRFLSEEFPEFVGTKFNDAFIAEIDTTSWQVAEDGTISRPNDFASSPEGTPISVNGVGPTAVTPTEAEGTYFDAATGLITTKAPITPGAHSLYFSIFDASDHIYDSAVFLDNLRFLNEGAATCKPPTTKEPVAPPAEPVAPPAGSPTPAPSPPVVRITSGPPHESAQTGTKFTFAGVAGGTYECTIDGGPFRPCSSGQSYGSLLPGDHLFQVRETLAGVTGPVASYRWTIDLPKQCVLRVARARVFVFTSKSKVRLVIHYTSYRPATVTVDYKLSGTKGKLELGSASAKFMKKGVFRLPERLDKEEMGKVRAAKSFKVHFKIAGTPGKCKAFYTKQLTIPEKISKQTVWFQSDSQFAPQG